MPLAQADSGDGQQLLLERHKHHLDLAALGGAQSCWGDGPNYSVLPWSMLLMGSVCFNSVGGMGST